MIAVLVIVYVDLGSLVQLVNKVRYLFEIDIFLPIYLFCSVVPNG